MVRLASRPRRQAAPQLYHAPPSQQNQGMCASLFTRQTAVVLLTGMLLGYCLLPLVMVSKLGFDHDGAFTVKIGGGKNGDTKDGEGTVAPTIKMEDLKDPFANADGGKAQQGMGIRGGVAGLPKLGETTTRPNSRITQEEDGADEAGAEDLAKQERAEVDGGEGGGDSGDGEGKDVVDGDVKTETEAGAADSGTTVEKTTTTEEAPKEEHHTEAANPEELKAGNLHIPGVPHDKIKPKEDLSETEQRALEESTLFATQSMPTSTTPYVMKTSHLPDSKRMTILVTGGAGFVGSHLVDKLMMEGHEVIVADNFFTGQKKNIEHWLHHPNFRLIVHDVTEPLTIEVDQIYHLACPASPPHYQYNPVKTIKTSTMGTINMLGLAKRVKARMLLASTSEIYGDPQVHPQPESYWGNVNTIGPRSCYDEGKRVAETMMYSYRNQNDVEVRVARIFNTFGPRMHPNDGRVVSNFIIQALQDKPLTVYGEGKQTRSFQYVSDLVDGLHALMNGEYDLPVNLGNPDEYTVKEFAGYIKELTGSKSEIEHLPASTDDPTQRKPDISTAKKEIGWEPRIKVKEGLKEAVRYFSGVLEEMGEIIPTGATAAKPKPLAGNGSEKDEGAAKEEM